MHGYDNPGAFFGHARLKIALDFDNKYSYLTLSPPGRRIGRNDACDDMMEPTNLKQKVNSVNLCKLEFVW